MKGVNSFRIYRLHHFDQVIKIRMITQWKRGVALISKPAVWIHRPTRDHRRSSPGNFTQHSGIDYVGRTDQDLAFGCVSNIRFILGKTLAKLFIDFGELLHRPMQHQRQPHLAKAAKQFLAFAKRIPKQNRRFTIVERFPAKPDHTLNHALGRRKNILGPAVCGFHDQNVRWTRLAFFSGHPFPQFKVARI